MARRKRSGYKTKDGRINKFWAGRLEAPKDNFAVPDLPFGIEQQRDPNGQLFIYLSMQPANYIVIGKYADASECYYISDYTWPGINAKQTDIVDDLLMAVSLIQEIIVTYEARIAKDVT